LTRSIVSSNSPGKPLESSISSSLSTSEYNNSAPLSNGQTFPLSPSSQIAMVVPHTHTNDDQDSSDSTSPVVSNSPIANERWEDEDLLFTLETDSSPKSLRHVVLSNSINNQIRSPPKHLIQSSMQVSSVPPSQQQFYCGQQPGPQLIAMANDDPFAKSGIMGQRALTNNNGCNNNANNNSNNHKKNTDGSLSLHPYNGEQTDFCKIDINPGHGHLNYSGPQISSLSQVQPFPASENAVLQKNANANNRIFKPERKPASDSFPLHSQQKSQPHQTVGNNAPFSLNNRIESVSANNRMERTENAADLDPSLERTFQSLQLSNATRFVS